MQVLDLKQVEDRYWILDQELDDVWKTTHVGRNEWLRSTVRSKRWA
jgi:hypothetical protein